MASANANTIVVLNAGSAVIMPWIDDVPAVLQLWYPGQEGGNALADVVFGEVNPSGRLPTTFPRRLQDTPAFINYPGENGKVYYGEGLYVGYSYFDKRELKPLFPFGYGLSYTSFQYSDLTIDLDDAVPEVCVTCQITNIGEHSGKEVVQLYVHDGTAHLDRPIKELKAFVKVSLAAGETKTVTLQLDRQAFAYYDPVAATWISQAGEFAILAGHSAADIRLSGQLLWPGHTNEQPAFHVGLPLRILLADERCHAVLGDHLRGEFLNHPQ